MCCSSPSPLVAIGFALLIKRRVLPGVSRANSAGSAQWLPTPRVHLS
jgi:hypothetical protein